jgi:hypothetical protein
VRGAYGSVFEVRFSATRLGQPGRPRVDPTPLTELWQFSGRSFSIYLMVFSQ